MDKPFNPEKHGMVMCPECKGDGKLPRGPRGAKVCSRCGGFGLIKKEQDHAEQDLSVEYQHSTASTS
jgi:DnaJ-class molecular chaperone